MIIHKAMPYKHNKKATLQTIIMNYILNYIKNGCSKRAPKESQVYNYDTHNIAYKDKIVNYEPYEFYGNSLTTKDAVTAANLYLDCWITIWNITRKQYAFWNVIKAIEWYIWRWTLSAEFTPKPKVSRSARIIDMYDKCKVLILEGQWQMTNSDMTIQGIDYKAGYKFKPRYVFYDCKMAYAEKGRDTKKTILPIVSFGSTIIFRDAIVAMHAPFNTDNPAVPIIFPNLRAIFTKTGDCGKQVKNKIMQVLDASGGQNG